MSAKKSLLACLVIVTILGSFVTFCSGIPMGLRCGTFDPDVAPPIVPNELRYGVAQVEPREFFIVQFDGPITPEMRASLTERGARILRYLPMYAYVVKMAGAGCRQLVDEGAIYHVELFQPYYKISPRLFSLMELLGGVAPDKPTVELTVQVFAGEDCDTVSKTINASGFSAREVAISVSQRGGKIRLSVASSEVGDFITFVSRIKAVEWIEEWFPFELDNHESRWIIQSYQEDYTPLWDAGLDGTGQLVAIGDTGVDADMCYFYDSAEGLPNDVINHDQRKIIVYYDMAGAGDWDGHDHGTHVACTVAGDNSENEGQPDTQDGMAYNAKLVFLDIGDGGSLVGIPYDLNDYFIVAYNAGARIHSNSWGASVYGAYTTDSQACDEFIWDHPDFLALFSNGNDGEDGGNSVGSPATAKGILSSGATENYYPTSCDPEDMAYFSSLGPCDDGRMKPTVGAPGHYVVSANNDFSISSYNCDTRTMSGTSMSCPVHAGAAALVRQFFIDGYYPTGEANPDDSLEPSAALMKAVMVNSGSEMTGDMDGTSVGNIPNDIQGWGRTTLEDTLYLAGDDQPLWVADETTGLQTGESQEYNVRVSADYLEVTLVWTDYPAATYAEPCLVNDLDLEVTRNGTTYLGNVYSGGQSTTGGSPDRLNPAECVQLNAPEPGGYTITVHAHNVPNGPQPFALVISGVSGDTGETAHWPMFRHNPRHTGRTGICSFDTSPTIKWSYTASANSYSSPVEGTDGAIYFMMSDGNLMASEPNGAFKWSYNVGATSSSTPAVTPEGFIVVGNADGVATAVNPDGSLAWTCYAGNAIYYEVTADADSNSCFTTMSNKVVMLSPTGATITTFYVNGLPKSPVITDTDIYVGTTSGYVYELHIADGSTTALTSGLGDISNSAAMDENGSIYVGNAAGTLYKVASSGTIEWSYSAGDRIASSVAIATDGTVVFGSNANKIIALESNGTLKWSYDTADRVSSSPALDCSQNVVVGCRNGVVYHLDKDGNLNWSLDVGGDVASAPAITQDGDVVVVNGSKLIYIARSNTAPVLSDDSFSPLTGNTDTDFSFYVHYHDSDSDAPDTIYVNVSGTEYEMTLDSGDPADGVYTAQITLPGGDHQIFYYVEDGFGGSDRIPESGTKQGPVVNYDPELADGVVTPTTGTVSTEFEYAVHYYDLEGQPPSVASVCIDGGTPTTMTLESGDPADGVYTYWTYLSSGIHEYSFYFEDDQGGSTSLPDSGTYDGPTVTDEYEPDDTCEDAKPISDDGTRQSRMLLPEGDQDWVEFEAQLGAIYVSQTYGSTDTYMCLYASDCTTMIDYDDDGGEGLNALIEWTCASADTYYLMVEGWSFYDIGEYELELLLTDQAPVLYDPAIDPEAGYASTEFEYTVRYYDSAGGPPTIASVYIDEAAPATMTLKSGDTADGVYTYSTYLLEGTHDYWFYFENDEGQSARSPSSGSYDGPAVIDEYEPDDTCENAALISTDGTLQSRSINPEGDRDWVEFEAELNGLYVAQTYGEVDTYMYLLADDCVTVITQDDDDGEGLNALIQWTCETPGTYYLLVEGYDEEEVGDYELELLLTNFVPDLSYPSVDPECADQGSSFLYSVHYYDRDGDAAATMAVYVDGSPYGMTLASGDASDGTYEYEAASLGAGRHTYRFYFVDVRGGEAWLPRSGFFQGPFLTDEFEDDDTCASATHATVGTTQYHTFCPEADVDWVRFDAETGQDYLIRTYGLSDGADTLIYLYQDDCETLIISDDDSGPGMGSQIDWHCDSSGACRVKIEEKTGEVGGYNLFIGLRTPETEWLSFHHNNQNTGRTHYCGPGTPELKWTYATGDYIYDSSAAIDANGTAYIGSRDNYVYAIESDGTVAWSFDMHGKVDSGPAVDAEGNVYVDAWSEPPGGHLYKLNSTGVAVWSYYTRSGDSSPVVDDDGTVFVGSTESKFIAIASDGTLKWSYDLSNPCYSHPCLDGLGNVYFGTLGDYVYCLDTENGSVNWSYVAGGAIEGGVALDLAGRALFGSADDKLYCLNPDGTFAWSYTTGDDVDATPAIGVNGSVYFGSCDNTFYALDADGNLLWSYETGDNIRSSAAIDGNGNLYFGSADTNLYCLSSGGALLWTWQTGDEVHGSPAIAPDGSVVFGSLDYKIYCLTAPENQCPTLSGEDVSPPFGKSANAFTYSVDCLDPDSADISASTIFIDDTPYDMALSSGATTDGTYVYTTSTLSAGTHEYYFLFDDSDGCETRYPTSGTLSGPIVDDTRAWSECSSPTYTTDATIAVNFVAGDTGGSGLYNTKLYYRFGTGGNWTYYNYLEGSSGTFLFFASEGEGTYYFQTLALDWAGNLELGPIGDGDDSTIYDLTAPSSSCSSPEFANSSPIEVTFFASDAHSGVTQVVLFYNYEGLGWTDSGLSSSGGVTEGTLDFTPTDGEGIYQFYTVATDNVGNTEAPPGAADDSTEYDTTAPQSSCTSPGSTR